MTVCLFARCFIAAVFSRIVQAFSFRSVSMSENTPSTHATISRRDVLRAAGSTAAVASATLGMRGVHADNPSGETLKVGLIGAGGRGRGAIVQTLSVPGSNVKLTAIADAFKGGIDGTMRALNEMQDKVDCPEDRRYDGLEGYKRVIDASDLVILATPPGFRPFQFDAAVQAGKHVFMEKPVCVDSYGARRVLEAARLADEKKLKVVVGLQRRYQTNYREALTKVREGMIGDIIGGQVYWNGSGIWFRDREPNQTEMQYQVNNWYHFNWLSGDHICEQHVHNIDIANWFLDSVPISAYGVGGRQQRVPGQSSEIYDHHAVNFAYPGGVRIASQCKQFPGGENHVEEHFQGTKGMLSLHPGYAKITDLSGQELWKFSGENPDPYQVEHDELHAAIRNDTPKNDAYYGATSSFSSVLGRLATYSGKTWKYDDTLQLDFRTMPEDPTWETTPPTVPDKDGNYALPMPATFKIQSVTKPVVS
jgi:myo-inositol 2-dehydrogenase / D-chiro-inositol 1-dehydrogenase